MIENKVSSLTFGDVKKGLPSFEIRRGGSAAPRSDRRSFPYIIS